MSSPKKIDRSWHYELDKEGVLWHEGTELEDPSLLKFFMEKIEQLPDGRFHVLCQGEDCFITAEDVPYVVQNVNITPTQVELVFPGDYREKLDPSTLYVGKENVLYSLVRNQKFTARFNRKSYLELAKHIQFDKKQKNYTLVLNGKKFPVHGV